MIINMNIGGTEKALLNMISEMSKEDFDITILMLEKKGGFIEYIPEHVKIDVLSEYKNIKEMIQEPIHISALKYLKKGDILKVLILVYVFLYSKITRENSLLFKYLLKHVPTRDCFTYDTAVAYAGPMDFISYYILKRVKADKKIQWIHFDITKIGFNTRFVSKFYKMFDKIFVVSEEAKAKLINEVPLLKYNTETFNNIVSPSMIFEQSIDSVGFEDNQSDLRILTVGRLSFEKGQDMAIKVLARLKKNGYRVKWYCIGDGKLREEYLELIQRYGLKEDFILLGAIPNPYPYLRQCDIYVQPSRFEGYCITTLEAKCFNKPILSTDVNGVKEQLENGKTGVIVKIDENDIYQGLKELIDRKEIRDRLSANLEIENKSDKEAENKVKNLIFLG